MYVPCCSIRAVSTAQATPDHAELGSGRGDATAADHIAMAALRRPRARVPVGTVPDLGVGITVLYHVAFFGGHSVGYYLSLKILSSFKVLLSINQIFGHT